MFTFESSLLEEKLSSLCAESPTRLGLKKHTKVSLSVIWRTQRGLSGRFAANFTQSTG